MQFLKTEIQLEEMEALDIVRNIWNCISLGGDFHDVMDMVNERDICFSGEQDLTNFVNIMMNVNNRTRMMINRGYMPNELATQRGVGVLGLDGKMPLIVPMSSTAANMLGESKQKLHEMGLSIDLDANARVLPMEVMPEGLDGSMETRNRKVYPNDPCPCGSGRKYKKCCRMV